MRKREDAEASLRALARQLISIRDEERRRVAHELHESTAQVLATLAINMSVLAERRTEGREAKLISESTGLVETLLGEVRRLSHLLHPPTLDEMGLPSALQWYAEQFARRSNIAIALEVPPDLGRLSREKEIAIFRLVQESLTNLQEHSGSASARVQISKLGRRVFVEVSDHGKGISPGSAEGWSGLEISGMRERLRQLGGTLSVSSSQNGTRVAAELPA